MKNRAGSLSVLDILFLFSFFFQDIQKGESVFLLLQVYFGRTHLSFKKKALASKKNMASSTKSGGDHEGMGTYIIQKLVKSASGRLDFTYRHPVFRLEIKIPFQK